MDWLKQLKVDVDRMEYYSNAGNLEKVKEYEDLIVSHVKHLLNETDS